MATSNLPGKINSSIAFLLVTSGLQQITRGNEQHLVLLFSEASAGRLVEFC